jgi:hypothetical protein
MYNQIYVTQIACVVFPLISVLLLLYSRCDSLSCSEFCPFHRQKKYQEPSNEQIKQHQGGMMENDIYKSVCSYTIPSYVQIPPDDVAMTAMTETPSLEYWCYNNWLCLQVIL